jgi:hypothetical protein
MRQRLLFGRLSDAAMRPAEVIDVDHHVPGRRSKRVSDAVLLSFLADDQGNQHGTRIPIRPRVPHQLRSKRARQGARTARPSIAR